MVQNYYTTRDAAKMLGISVRTAQQWLEKGYLKGWKTSGGHRRILRSSVSKLLAASPPVAVAPPVPQSLQVLVVEDNEALLKLYRLQIARWKLPVMLYTAANGYEGLVMVGKALPDLLICDLRLPGVTGFQIVRALCAMESFQQLAIVVVSALPSEEIDAHGSLPPRVEQMGKPIDFERLHQLAQSLWERRVAALA